MKHVVYVHYQECERDGSYVHTRMFAREFKQLAQDNGFRFSVIQPPVIDHAGTPEITKLQQFKTTIARFYISDIKAVLMEWKKMQAERRQLQAMKADIVLARYEWKNLSIIWAARSLGIPVVLELNSPDEEDLGLKFYRLPGMARFFSTSRALSLCNGGFAVTEVLAKSFRQQVAKNIPVRSIPNGVLIEQFDPQLDGSSVRNEVGISPNKIVLGFVGSFAPWHGLDLLFSAFAQLLSEGLPVHLMLVGQVRQDAGEWLTQAQSENFSAHVTLTGHVPQAKINEYLAAMDIAVLSNSAWYCSPLKVFEYMAMAKATVAVATEPVREMMSHEKDGLLFEQGSVKALTAELRKLVMDDALRTALGAAARKRVASEYTWADNARRVGDLLQDIYSEYHTRS